MSQAIIMIYINITNFVLISQGHVHKYEAAFGWGVDILMAVTFLSIALFWKQNQKMI